MMKLAIEALDLQRIIDQLFDGLVILWLLDDF